jgi:hypothetical protein
MKRLITTIPSLLVIVHLSFGQEVKPISINRNPKVESSTGTKYNRLYKINVELFDVVIDEHFTVIRIIFDNKQEKILFRIPPETQISDYSNNMFISSISHYVDAQGVRKLETNMKYPLNNIGKYAFDLVFGRIPPGIEKFNIEMPFEDRNI